MESPNCNNCAWYLCEEDGQQWCLERMEEIGDVELCTRWVRKDD